MATVATHLSIYLCTYLFSAVMDKLSLLIAVVPRVDLSSSLVTADMSTFESSVVPSCPCCCLSFVDAIGTIIAVASGMTAVVEVVTVADG